MVDRADGHGDGATTELDVAKKLAGGDSTRAMDVGHLRGPGNKEEQGAVSSGAGSGEKGEAGSASSDGGVVVKGLSGIDLGGDPGLMGMRSRTSMASIDSCDADWEETDWCGPFRYALDVVKSLCSAGRKMKIRGPQVAGTRWVIFSSQVFKSTVRSCTTRTSIQHAYLAKHARRGPPYT